MLPAILKIVILIYSVILHEYAHGYVALLFGDTTARDRGRLTLNPIPHIDIFGTILLPLLMTISGSSVVFGWAKPVPINPYYMRDRSRGLMFVGAAGPLTNISIAVVASFLFHIVGGNVLLASFLLYACYINLFLMIFNLIPVPPLDGSRVLFYFLPTEAKMFYARLERYGFFIIFIILYLNLDKYIIFPIFILLLRFLKMPI